MKHRLVLTIRERGREPVVWTSGEFSLSDHACKVFEYPYGEISYAAEVEAQVTNVEFASGENENLFVLQLDNEHGNEPYRFTRNCAGRFFRPGRNAEGLATDNDKCYSARLFYEGVGPECIALKCNKRNVCEIDVDVKASRNKTEHLFRMITEILGRNPFLALATADQKPVRSKLGMLVPRPKDGDAAGDDSVSSGIVRLRLVEWVMRELKVPLRAISSTPIRTIRTDSVRMPIRKCRHLKPKSYRTVRLNSKGFTVRSGVRSLSCDTVQNRVIRRFLQDRLSEVEVIRRDLESEKRALCEGKKIRRETIESYLAEVGRLERDILNVLHADFLVDVRVAQCVSVFQFPRSLFDASKEYGQVYLLMANYEMVCAFWRSGTGSRIIPRYCQSCCVERRFRQNPYSLIYEAWCFLKVMDAFALPSVGFDIAEQYNKKVVRGVQRSILLMQNENDPVYAENRKLGLEVALFYRVRAHKSDAAGYFSVTGFKPRRRGKAIVADDETGDVMYSDDLRDLTTPDFVIAFRRCGTGAQPRGGAYVVVLDSKAVDGPIEDDVQLCLKRRDYLRALKLVRFRLGDNQHLKYPAQPSQSWLLYPGVEGDAARIEFDDVKDDCDDDVMWPNGASRVLSYFVESNHPEGNLRIRAAENEGALLDVLGEWVGVMAHTARAYFRRTPDEKLI